MIVCVLCVCVCVCVLWGGVNEWSRLCAGECMSMVSGEKGQGTKPHQILTLVLLALMSLHYNVVTLQWWYCP